MSKGPGKLQRAILDILGEKLRRVAHPDELGPTDTSKLCDELIAHGYLNPLAPRKQLIGAVVRACVGLVNQGLLVCGYDASAAYPGRTVTLWATVIGSLRYEVQSFQGGDWRMPRWNGEWGRVIPRFEERSEALTAIAHLRAQHRPGRYAVFDRESGERETVA